MRSLKELIHEIHRRSLWQVTGIFLAASWGVLQVVEVLTETAGLPDWTPSMALVLLLIGLPICLATAFVQEGMPGADAELDAEGASESGAPVGEVPARGADPPSPAVNLAAGTGSLDRPSTRPSKARRTLTWRNALVGGLGAFALLSLSLVAYFVMWATGVGPVGNLVAQGVIADGDRVLLADFADATGEGLGSVVTEALRVDLTQAEVFALVNRVDLEPTLALMQVAPGAPLSPEIALQVAVRDGIPAIIEGAVSKAGAGYLITSTLRAVASGRPLATFRTSAEGPDRIIASIDKLSQDIRERSGESLRNIKAGEPLEQVTTSSLEALRLYTEASTVFGSANWDATIDLLERAVAIDPAFAMAWRRLASAYQSSPGGGGDEGFGGYPHAATQAYQHRDRLTERERLLTEAAYHMAVTRDLPRVIAAYQAVLEVNPDDGTALNNIANAYNDIGERELGRDTYQRAVDGPGRTSTAMGNLALSHLFLGDFEAAAQVLAEYEAEYPEGSRIAPLRFHVALLSGALGRAEELARARFEDPTLSPVARSVAAEWLAKIAYRRGRLDEAREYGTRAARIGGQASEGVSILRASFAIYREALLGDPVHAAQLARENLAWFGEAPGALGGLLANTLAITGQTDIALAVHAARPDDTGGVGGFDEGVLVPLTIRVLEGDTVGAMSALDALLEEQGCTTQWCAQPERAVIAAASGHPDLAIQLYESLADRGGEGDFFMGVDDIFARLRLGPAYEEAGDTARAIEAYQRIVDMWGEGDARGRAVVRAYQARIDALRGPSGP